MRTPQENQDLIDAWNLEYRQFMSTYQPKASPLISTWDIYHEACNRRQKEIAEKDKMKTEYAGAFLDVRHALKELEGEE